ncbi:MAG: FtsX-like permease family protein [Acidimicrobiaceae bacterium]|nr:FtsX-like permease family protein [Acidimicrobiaceae bacterium]
MLRLALKSLVTHKIRFALTAGTIVLGVTFVVAAFVTADSLRATFDEVGVDINTGKDFTVRGALGFGEIANAPPVPDSLVDSIRAIDGVEVAEGRFFVDGVIPVDGSGEAVSTLGGPLAGVNWLEDESLSQYFLISGRWPQERSEFAINAETFADYDFELGRDYQVVTPTGPRTFTLTGTMQFGFPEDAGAGVVFTVFDPATAQEVLGYEGLFNEIDLRAVPGADLEQVRDRIEAALPAGTEVISAEEAAEEFGDFFEFFIGPLQTILLTFAFVVLFVSTFIISNTFNIVLGQRVRELSLLRALGATPRQVRRSVLIESVVIGVAASAAGIGLGLLGALGLGALFDAFGASLPDGPMPLRPRTVAWAFAVGVGFTVIASLVPAVKASRVSPVAGLQESSGDDGGHLRLWRPILGAALGAVGLVLTGRGLFADFDSTTAQLLSLGIGAAVVFVAVAVLSPLIAGSVVSALARPLPRILRTPGRLARDNAARSPRRTAATAVALTIGLALVAMVLVVGQSLKDTFSDSLSSAVRADYIISAQTISGVPKTLAEDLRGAGAGTVVGLDEDLVQIFSPVAPDRIEQTEITVTELAAIDQVANLGVTQGSLSAVDPASALLVNQDAANEWGLSVGDPVELVLVNGETLAVTVGAVFTETQPPFWDDWLIDRSLYEQAVAADAFEQWVAVKGTGSDPGETRALLEQVLSAYPQANLEDRQQFQESAESNLNTVLALVNVFLLFALVVALVGIVNTLTLSVFERTHEIGLLRAVGMTRRQLRRVIRWEAATIALYGAIIGVALGLAFGVALAVAIPDEIIDRVSVPAWQVVGLVVVAVAFGLLAAVFPSYRAGRMNVLDAIAAD